MVEDVAQLQRALNGRKRQEALPTVKKFVLMEGSKDGVPNDLAPSVTTWQELLEIGRNESDASMREREKEVGVNSACLLIYTSGTTGQPKGKELLLSHAGFGSFGPSFSICLPFLFATLLSVRFENPAV